MSAAADKGGAFVLSNGHHTLQAPICLKRKKAGRLDPALDFKIWMQGACKHPNLLVLPLRLERIRLAALPARKVRD